MDREPIQFKPGVFRQGSEAEMSGAWYETNLIRWVGGVMRPIDGWEKIVFMNGDAVGTPFPGFASIPRKVHTWVTRDGIKRTAVLCEENLYVMTAAGEVYDITPTDKIQGPGDPTKGGYGDNIYYGAGGGLANPDQLYPDLVPTPPPPHYPDPLPPGHDPGPQEPLFTDPNGYGMQRPDKPPGILIVGPMWSLDNFGDDLIAMASTDMRLLRWKPATPAVKAAEVVARPPDTGTGDPGGGSVPRGRCFVVTPERHVVVFGNGNKFNQFEWCSQEDIEDWKYDNTENSAGSYDLEPAAPFVTAVVSRYGVLAFTVTEVYLITYAGSPYVYSYAYLGNFNAPLAGDSITVLPAKTVWHASDGFWQFDGVNVAPIPCPILDWVQQMIDPAMKFRRCASIPIGVQSEVWFFFPERGALENTHFAAYNFDERWWSMGKLSRTCGEAGSSLTYPIMADPAGGLYYHEKGRFYAGLDELPYAQSAAINVAAGAKQCTLRQGLVDTRSPAGDVQFWIGARKARIADASNIQDIRLSLVPMRDRGRLDFRVTGRDAFIRIQSIRNGSEPWTFGQFLVKKIPRGGR